MIMAFVLNGIVRGMRVVGNPAGPDADGKQWEAGEKWRFLSLEMTDPRHGGVYSCQLSDKDPQYSTLVEKDNKLKKDYTGYSAKVTVRSIEASQRDLKDKEGNVIGVVPQARIRVTNLRDLTLPKDDD